MFSTLNPQMLKRLFPAAFYEKGFVYYLEKRVKNVEIVELPSHFQIVAEVRGRQRYEVQIEVFTPPHKFYIKGDCTCPMSVNCKHVVATLLQVIQAPAGNAISEKNKTSTERIDPKIAAWLSDLSNAVEPRHDMSTVVDESSSLHYLLSLLPYREKQLQVEFVLARNLKNGTIGKEVQFNPASYNHQRHLYEMDRLLLKKLGVRDKKDLAREIDIPNFAEGEQLLISLIETGRAHWEAMENPSLILSGSRKAAINWCVDKNGCQELKWEEHDNHTYFAVDNLWYLNEKTGGCGILHTDLEPRLIRILLSAPKIPPEQANQVTQVLEKISNESPISKIKKFDQVATKEMTPKVILKLFALTVQVPGGYHNAWKRIEAKIPAMELLFEYLDHKISWADVNETFQHIEPDRVINIVRDQRFEDKAVNLLSKHYLVTVGELPRIFALEPEAEDYFSFQEWDNPLEFSTKVIPKLRKKGWHIEISDDFPFRVVEEPIEEWYSSIQESSGYDWFGLDLGIMVQGDRINLLPIIQKMLPKILSYQQTEFEDPEDSETYVQLQDGRHIRLPLDRLKAILDVLLELHDGMPLVDSTMLRLSRLQAMRLLELEAAVGKVKLRWFGGEKIRDLAKRIASFEGVKNVLVPKDFCGELRAYQQAGLNWLQFLREFELGGILADDMGLGKTIQALVHIMVEKDSGRMQMPCLVVAPTSLMFNWRKETERFCPKLKYLILHGADRHSQYENLNQYDVVITTYPLLLRDKEILIQQSFYLLILDEAQAIKNAKNLSTQIALQIKAQHRLCLTGTPMENHLGELWSLFHFLMPGLLGSQKQFNRQFRNPIEKESDLTRQAQLNKRVAPFLLRRKKDEVARELPPKIEMIREVELEGAQRDLYETIRITMQEKVRAEIAKMGLAKSHIIILDALLKLRQVCCDPRLLKISSSKKKHAQSAKFELLMTLLSELVEEGRRILLFSQFTEMLALIEDALVENNIAYVKLTGQTRDRETPVKSFQAGKVPLFLISLKAGGTGLNLTKADTVIHYDPWWNPAVENQATDRAHRIGQDKTVFVYKLVAKGTVEEKILEMQQHKHQLMAGLFSDKSSGKLQLTEQDFAELFEPLSDNT